MANMNKLLMDIILWVMVWNLIDFIINYYKIKPKLGIIYSISIILFILYIY